MSEFTDRNTLFVEGTLLPAEAYCEYNADNEEIVCQVISQEAFVEEWPVDEDMKEPARAFLEEETFETFSKIFTIDAEKVTD